MDRQGRVKYSAAMLACCLVVTFGISFVGTGTVAAQQSLDVTVDVPQEATAGESTTLSATVSVPDLPGNYENDLTVTFYSDGQQIGSETVTVSDGETTAVNRSHTFETGGDKEIRIEASTTLGGQEYSGHDTTTLSVSAPEQPVSIDGNLSLRLETPASPEVGNASTTTVQSDTPSLIGVQEGALTLRLLVDGEAIASKTVTVSGNETTTTTNFTTVFESSGETTVTVEAVLTAGNQTVSETVSTTINVSEATPDTTTVEGAVFTIPESLEDEVDDYRANASRELDAYAFVLATRHDLYIVFTQQEPTKGIASVEGPVLAREVATDNLTYGVIASTNVSFQTIGTAVSVPEVSNNSEQYRLELVRVTAQYRRVSLLTDPDTGANFTLSTTSGVLIENPQTTTSLFQNVGSNARELSRNTSTERIDTVLDNPQSPHLHTVSFETKFWTDAEATVDAVVLDPRSAARQFIDEYDRAGVAHAEDGEPILYVVAADFKPQQLDSVASINSQSDSLDGEVVKTEVRLYQEQISVQETLEHNTGCEEDLLEIQTPEGSACVNVVQDNLLHGGIAWTSLPQSREDTLLVMGVSSRHQDSPAEFETGRYRIEGEVVSTSRLNETLPDGSVLIIYDMERVDAIDYGAVAEEARSLIETRTDELTTRLRQQIGNETEQRQINISLTPDTRTIQSNTTTSFEVRVSDITQGLGSYEFVITTANSSVARITDVTPEGTTSNSLVSTSVASDGSEATVVVSNTDTANTGTVTALRVTIQGVNPGETALALRLHEGNAPTDEDADPYTVGTINDASITVSRETGPGDLTGNGDPATDPDGDGAYEDINGDGRVTAADVTALFDLIISGELPATTDTLDINGNNDGVTAADVTTLFNEILGG